jgi:hypothetical protein
LLEEGKEIVEKRKEESIEEKILFFCINYVLFFFFCRKKKAPSRPCSKIDDFGKKRGGEDFFGKERKRHTEPPFPDPNHIIRLGEGSRLLALL